MVNSSRFRLGRTILGSCFGPTYAVDCLSRCPSTLFSAVRAHFSPGLYGWNYPGTVDSYPNEVVSSSRKGENPSDFEHTTGGGSCATVDCLHPVEDFLHPLLFLLDNLISGMAGGATTHCAAAWGL